MVASSPVLQDRGGETAALRVEGKRVPAEGEWDQESPGRSGGVPTAAWAPIRGGEPMAAAEQSSGRTGGGRKVGGTYLEFVKTSGASL